jgi:hypothetical protein
LMISNVMVPFSAGATDTVTIDVLWRWD